MPSMLQNLRLLADPSRIRILLLVTREELSVAELQNILNMGQSRISTHLGPAEKRRPGRRTAAAAKASSTGCGRPAAPNPSRSLN